MSLIQKKSTKTGNTSGNILKDAESSSNNSANFKKNKTCFLCGKNDHFKKECRFYKRLKTEANAGQKKANIVERPPSPFEIIAMIVELKISMITECNMATTDKTADWWYDFGATVHVWNDKILFKNYEVASKDENVLIGNHDTAKVHGKGTVELQFTSGKKLILMNVFHVHDVKKNLIFTSLLCKKGLKAVLEAGKFIFSKNGFFVGQGYSCDGMFKLSINKVDVIVYILESLFNL